MNAQRIRRVLVLATMLLSVVIAYGQMALGLGLSPADFASEGDTTLRAAAYAFSIWGVIYIALFAYAIYQFVPRTAETTFLRVFGWASVVAFVGISAWVIAAASNAKWATVTLIFASAVVLVVTLGAGRGLASRASRTARMFVVWPLALLAGWLTIASLVNLLTVLTAKFMLGSVPPFFWAVGGVVVAGLVTVAVVAWTRAWIFAAPVIWGLVGVFTAEREDGAMPLALIALVVAFLIAMAVAVVMVTRKPAVKVVPETPLVEPEVLTEPSPLAGEGGPARAG